MEHCGKHGLDLSCCRMGCSAGSAAHDCDDDRAGISPIPECTAWPLIQRILISVASHTRFICRIAHQRCDPLTVCALQLLLLVWSAWMLFGRPVSHPGPARAQPIERHAQWPAGKTHSFDGKWQFASGPESHQVTLQSVEIAVPMCW